MARPDDHEVLITRPAGAPSAGLVRLHELLHLGLEESPERPAFIEPDRRTTYAALSAMTQELFSGLRRHGVEPSDRLLIALAAADTASALFASSLAGTIACIAQGSDARSLRQAMEQLQPSVLLTTAEAFAPVRRVMPASVKLVFVRSEGVWQALRVAERGHEDKGSEARTFQRDDRADQETAAILLTSGSSGRRKGVMLSHAGMLSTVQSILGYLPVNREDVVLNLLPLSFGYGLYQALVTLRAGGSVLSEPSFISAASVWRRAAEAGATVICCVPDAIDIMRRANLPGQALPNLRYLHTSGSRFTSRHLDWLRARFQGLSIFSAYGLTECQRVSCLPPAAVDRHPDSVGWPISRVAAQIVDDDGRTLDRGQTGELVVSGPNLMEGYWQSDEFATTRLTIGQQAPHTPMLHTGDMFRRDERDLLYFMGRRDRVVKILGYKVSLDEIEAALEIDGIIEVAVTPARDGEEHFGLEAHVVLSPDSVLTEREIIRLCFERLESYKVPRRVVFHQALPRTATGKLAYAALSNP